MESSTSGQYFPAFFQVLGSPPSQFAHNAAESSTNTNENPQSDVQEHARHPLTIDPSIFHTANSQLTQEVFHSRGTNASTQVGTEDAVGMDFSSKDSFTISTGGGAVAREPSHTSTNDPLSLSDSDLPPTEVDAPQPPDSIDVPSSHDSTEKTDAEDDDEQISQVGEDGSTKGSQASQTSHTATATEVPCRLQALDIKCIRKGSSKVLISDPHHTGNKLFLQTIRENQRTFDCASPKYKVGLVKDVIERTQFQSGTRCTNFFEQHGTTWRKLNEEEIVAAVFTAFWKGQSLQERLRLYHRFQTSLERTLGARSLPTRAEQVRSALNEFLEICPKLGVRSVDIKSNVRRSIASTLLIQADAKRPELPLRARAKGSNRSFSTDDFRTVASYSWSQDETAVVKCLQDLIDGGQYPQLRRQDSHGFPELNRILSQPSVVDGETHLTFKNENTHSLRCAMDLLHLVGFKHGRTSENKSMETIQITVKWHTNSNQHNLCQVAT